MAQAITPPQTEEILMKGFDPIESNRLEKQILKEWKEIIHYAGFDWARDHHAVVLIDACGQIVSEFQFDHTQEGWKSFLQKTASYPNLAVAIETNQGAAVDQLLQHGYTVYPVNPVASESYRKRKAPSGIKTDCLGAGRCLACRWSRLEGARSAGPFDGEIAAVVQG